MHRHAVSTLLVPGLIHVSACVLLQVLEDIVAGVSLLEGCSPLAFLLRVQTNAQLLALEQAVAATAGRARAQVRACSAHKAFAAVLHACCSLVCRALRGANGQRVAVPCCNFFLAALCRRWLLSLRIRWAVRRARRCLLNTQWSHLMHYTSWAGSTCAWPMTPIRQAAVAAAAAAIEAAAARHQMGWTSRTVPLILLQLMLQARPLATQLTIT